MRLLLCGVIQEEEEEEEEGGGGPDPAVLLAQRLKLSKQTAPLPRLAVGVHADSVNVFCTGQTSLKLFHC